MVGIWVINPSPTRCLLPGEESASPALSRIGPVQIDVFFFFEMGEVHCPLTIRAFLGFVASDTNCCLSCFPRFSDHNPGQEHADREPGLIDQRLPLTGFRSRTPSVLRPIFQIWGEQIDRNSHATHFHLRRSTVCTPDECLRFFNTSIGGLYFL